MELAPVTELKNERVEDHKKRIKEMIHGIMTKDGKY